MKTPYLSITFEPTLQANLIDSKIYTLSQTLFWETLTKNMLSFCLLVIRFIFIYYLEQNTKTNQPHLVY